MAMMNDKNMAVDESAVAVDDPYIFDDFFPSMIQSKGYDGLMKELCSGFCLLMDAAKGLITFESLKRSAFVLGLHDLGDEEIICMLIEGDMDGDGALNQTEFCILMLRLSSGLIGTCNSDPAQCRDGWMEDVGMNGMMSTPAL